MEDHIRLKGDLSRLAEKGIKVKRKFFGFSGIPFDSTVTSHFDNVDLIERLMELNRNQVLFGEDYKQAYSPADFMKELQEKGVLREDFRSIYWTGPDSWHVRENKVDQGGGINSVPLRSTT